MMNKKMGRPSMPRMATKVSGVKASPIPMPMLDDGVSMPNYSSRAKRPGGMAKGGPVHTGEEVIRKLVREEIGKAHKKMGMAKGGSVKAYAMGGMAQGYAKGGMAKGKKC